MDTKTFGLVGALGLVAAVLGYSYYQSSGKGKTASKQIDRGVIIRLLEEIKYQIFVICLEYAPTFVSVGQELKKQKKTSQEIAQYKQSQIIKIFKEKERLVLLKHNLTKEQFEMALTKTFASDKEINQYNQDIETMMQNTIQGKFSFDAPEQFKKHMKPSEALQLYKRIQLMLIQEMVRVFDEQFRKNPNFEIGNNEDTANVLRKLNIFGKKNDYLTQYGPKISSCTYTNFQKLIEIYKRQSVQFKSKVNQFDRLYSEYSNKFGQNIDLIEAKKKYDQVLEGTTVPLKQSDIIQDIKDEKSKSTVPVKLEQKQQEKFKHHVEPETHAHVEPKHEHHVEPYVQPTMKEDVRKISNQDMIPFSPSTESQKHQKILTQQSETQSKQHLNTEKSQDKAQEGNVKTQGDDQTESSARKNSQAEDKHNQQKEQTGKRKEKKHKNKNNRQN